MRWCYCILFCALLAVVAEGAETQDFERLCSRYLDEFPAHGPVSATTLGDHRFDGQLDDVSAQARMKAVRFNRDYLQRLGAIDRGQLSRDQQVDFALLENQLRLELWQLETLEEWAWNPLLYTQLAGRAVYGLMARDFAPLPERLVNVADRLEQFPRFLKQVRATLQPERVPRIHAEIALKQNRGVLRIIDNLVRPNLGSAPAAERQRLVAAMDRAHAAVDEHQRWLDAELLPNARGDFRLGKELYDRKLALTLQSPLTRQDIRRRADEELRRARNMMYDISKEVYREKYPYTQFPDRPSSQYQQAIIRACLEMAYRQSPARGEILDAAKSSLRIATDFVRRRDLITIPPDTLEIIVMPEFQRGVTLAYCDSAGPLEAKRKTFYAVSPLPRSWSDQQVESYMREYNVRSIHNLTVHEAMPGHFVQIAHSNRNASKLRAVLASGVFVEGWAVYAEQMMVDQGFLDGDRLMKLIVLKWYLRGVANAILDQAIHTDGISRDQAMRFMMEETFQEEREAAGKWTRAQLTSAQLSTYFVGCLEHTDLRNEAQRLWGADFQLKDYHDRVLAFGSPPVRYARALLLDEAIPK